MKPIFDMKRTNEVAAFVAAELRTLLDRRNFDGYMNCRLREAGPVYKGQTIGESLLATLLALNTIQNEVVRDLGSLETEISDWDGDRD